LWVGAAGNFLAPLSGLSENAYKTVIEIDTVWRVRFTLHASWLIFAISSEPLIPSKPLSPISANHMAHTSMSALLFTTEVRPSSFAWGLDTNPTLTGLPYQAHVSSAKAGVDALSRVIAVEEGPWGVRSNVIAPGPIAATEGMSRLSVSGTGPPIESYIPLGRQGATQDIANATVFLFSDAASLITGEALVVDGGLQHLSSSNFPYPDAVLDPESARKLFKGKL